MSNFPTKCEKCNSPWKWNKDFYPPTGSNRDKEGKPGWWEVDGKPHYKQDCEAAQQAAGLGSKTGSNDFKFSSDILMRNVVKHPTLEQGANYALQAIESAEEMMNTLYQSKVPDNLRGQIRNALTQNILLGQQNAILRDGFTAINEKLIELQKNLKASN